MKAVLEIQHRHDNTKKPLLFIIFLPHELFLNLHFKHQQFFWI